MSDGSWGLKADSSLAGRECVWVTKASGEVSVVDVGESVFESIEERIYVYWIVAEKPVPTDIADMSYAQFKVARAAAKRAAKKNAK